MQLLTISPARKELEEARQRAPLLTGDALRCSRFTIAGHSQRTALLAQTLARRLKCPEEEAYLIALAALVHDIGKLAIPAIILDKPGPLNEQEWTIMRLHPQIGYLMLSGAGGIYSRIAPLVLAHHERWDGLGYPFGLAGEAIPLGACILAVVDAYDAIIEWRMYRPSRSAKEAKAEVLRCAGSYFDPTVVEVLLQVTAGKRSVISQYSPPILGGDRTAQSAIDAYGAERDKQMFNGIFIPSIETQDSNELASSNEVLLSEAERDSLRLFVMGLGNRIEEDTSLFTSTERKRLAFHRWLFAHGKLLH